MCFASLTRPEDPLPRVRPSLHGPTCVFVRFAADDDVWERRLSSGEAIEVLFEGVGFSSSMSVSFIAGDDSTGSPDGLGGVESMLLFSSAE